MADSLSSELDRLVQQELATGEFGSRDEVLLAGVRMVGAYREHQQNLLRGQLKAGFDQLDRGEGLELDADGLRAFFDDIQNRGRERHLENQQNQ